MKLAIALRMARYAYVDFYFSFIFRVFVIFFFITFRFPLSASTLLLRLIDVSFRR